MTRTDDWHRKMADLEGGSYVGAGQLAMPPTVPLDCEMCGVLDSVASCPSCEMWMCPACGSAPCAGCALDQQNT